MTRPFALIIEDDPNLGRIFEKSLSKAGFETALDPDGNGYLDLLAANALPAILILDLHLPFASGPEILQTLRANPEWAKIPALIVTADLRLSKEMKLKGEQVLIKPFSPNFLIETVQAMLVK
jgi:DNA-binding response OmpR family regulator